MHDLPHTHLGERLRTTARLEGDVIVLSTTSDPEGSTGSITPEGAERSEAESEKGESSDGPKVPSTRLKYSRFRGDGKQDVDD